MCNYIVFLLVVCLDINGFKINDIILYGTVINVNIFFTFIMTCAEKFRTIRKHCIETKIKVYGYVIIFHFN